jgi:hypothetical protein
MKIDGNKKGASSCSRFQSSLSISRSRFGTRAHTRNDAGARPEPQFRQTELSLFSPSTSCCDQLPSSKRSAHLEPSKMGVSSRLYYSYILVYTSLLSMSSLSYLRPRPIAHQSTCNQAPMSWGIKPHPPTTKTHLQICTSISSSQLTSSPLKPSLSLHCPRLPFSLPRPVWLFSTLVP